MVVRGGFGEVGLALFDKAHIAFGFCQIAQGAARRAGGQCLLEVLERFVEVAGDLVVVAELGASRKKPLLAFLGAKEPTRCLVVGGRLLVLPLLAAGITPFEMRPCLGCFGRIHGSLLLSRQGQHGYEHLLRADLDLYPAV